MESVPVKKDASTTSKQLSILELLPCEQYGSIIQLLRETKQRNDLALTSKTLYAIDRLYRRKVVLPYDELPFKRSQTLLYAYPNATRVAIYKRRRHKTTLARTTTTNTRYKRIIENGFLSNLNIMSLGLHDLPRRELTSLSNMPEIGNIRKLDLSTCSELSDNIVRLLLPKLSQMTEFNISNCVNLTEISLVYALRHAPLTSLHASGLDGTKHPTTALGIEMPDALCELRLDKSYVRHDLLLVILSLATALESLDLSFYADQSDALLRVMSTLPRLKCLKIQSWKDTADFSPLANMQQLESLSLDVCWKFSSQSVDHLISLPHLSDLSVSHCALGVDDILRLMTSSKSNITHLRFWTDTRSLAVNVTSRLLRYSMRTYHCDCINKHNSTLVVFFNWANRRCVLHITHPTAFDSATKSMRQIWT